jgi:murein L,D-transpeptidase YafK
MRLGWRVLWCAGVVLVCTGFWAGQAWPARSRSQAELVIHVWKGRHEMVLQEGNRVIRRFHIALGKDPTASKAYRGDGRTPEGRYYVCEKRPRSRFRRFLGISYPNLDDAERAFAERLISANEWADIFFANLRQTTPPWSTAMGGRVGIHGYGGRKQLPVDWTQGCIAVSDADIDYLYNRVPLGTAVIISD